MENSKRASAWQHLLCDTWGNDPSTPGQQVGVPLQGLGFWEIRGTFKGGYRGYVRVYRDT